MRFKRIVVMLAAAIGGQAFGQTWDTSGNGMLSGTYYFREVIWLQDTVGYGDLAEAISLYGNITFDGNGGYSIANGQILDTNVGVPQALPTTTGTYSISASGYGFLTHPLSSGDAIYGSVAKGGIFLASSTEAEVNDLFIAAPLASPTPTSSFFRGTYQMMGFDSIDGTTEGAVEYQYKLTADGAGNLGSVSTAAVTAGYGTGNEGASRVTYIFSNGAAKVDFGSSTSNVVLLGQKYLYFSPDGNFVFGGSPNGWDMVIGVRTGGDAPVFNNLYYQAGMYEDATNIAGGYGDLVSFYGAFKASSGVILAHERLLSYFTGAPLDYTYSDTYTLASDGTYKDATNQYVFGPGGTIRIGLGIPPTIGLNVAAQAPSFTPSGVFIDPTGVVNAASSALFTAGVAPGELITIYGSNLSPNTLADASFPFQLGGVQVMVNNRPAPIYVVSSGQISAVVPFGTTEGIASIQVINNGTASNTVSSFVNLTAPGVFTKPEGGIGYAAALHPDYSLVTTSSPAQPGETVAVYLTGLGAVSPAVADGAPGPVTPLSQTTNTIQVFMNGTQATTTFVGLAPQLIGLYQINVTVPATITSGDVQLDIAGPDFYTSQALLPVGTPSASPLGQNARPAFTPHLTKGIGSGSRRKAN